MNNVKYLISRVKRASVLFRVIANLIGFNASFKITFNVSDFHRFMILYSTSYTFNCLISVSIDKTELVGNRLFTYLRSHLHIYECKKKRKIGYLYINLCYYAHRTYRKINTNKCIFNKSMSGISIYIF